MGTKALMIYDRNHNVLDEIDDYLDDLQYGWTLDDIDTLTVSLALSSPKCTPSNVQFGNHVELVDASGKTVWGGVIVAHDFSGSTVKITASDYSVLLYYRRLRAKQYPAMAYGALMQQMITDAQAARPDYPIGITGYNIASDALQTTRLVKSTDFLWSKIKEFGDDANYDYGMTPDRFFNFWVRRGSDKLKYIAEWGGNRDNIISPPTLARNIKSLENSVYAESEVTGDGSTSTTLTSSAEDATSEAIYGLYEGVFSPNDGVVIQSTLDTQVNGELQRNSIPADSVDITLIDSTLCPFDDLEVGDRIPLHLIPYFDYTASVRILAMQHTEKSNTRKVTVGSLIYRPAKPTKRYYKG